MDCCHLCYWNNFCADPSSIFNGPVNASRSFYFEFKIYPLKRFGRKKALLVGALPLLLGWILVGISKSLSVIYVSRVLCGFSYGLSYSVLPMYLAEIASDKIRGSITIILTVMAKCGILFSYLVGNYTSLYNAAWICKF